MHFVELSLDLNRSIEYLIVKLKVEFLIAMHLLKVLHEMHVIRPFNLHPEK